MKSQSQLFNFLMKAKHLVKFYKKSFAYTSRYPSRACKAYSECGISPPDSGQPILLPCKSTSIEDISRLRQCWSQQDV